MLNQSLPGLALLIIVTGCTLSAARYSDEQAKQFGFARSVITGNGFQHVAYRNQQPVNTGTLHVYLEGDGSPWIRERRVSPDPGPRKPLMLQLMALDSTPSVYLGRPCYHGFSDQPPCNPVLWTHGRYSLPVIDAMAQAMDTLVHESQIDTIVLMGYSGGGAIAMLLAERVPNVVAVVTIAGNLDPDKWASHHNYSPLWTSLNPANRKPLARRIYQLHLAAENDDVVPPDMLASSVANQENVETMIIPGADHVCCWQELWPSLLATLSARVKNGTAPN